jgi:hypothetical protein
MRRLRQPDCSQPPTTEEKFKIKFTANVGSTDRIVRLIIGVVLIGFTLTGTIGAWGWVGVVALATAFVKFCPAYAILGVRTCQTD